MKQNKILVIRWMDPRWSCHAICCLICCTICNTVMARKAMGPGSSPEGPCSWLAVTLQPDTLRGREASCLLTYTGITRQQRQEQLVQTR